MAEISDQRKAEYFKDWHNWTKNSRHAVERDFDSLDLELKQIIIALADIDQEDLAEQYTKGYKLRQYNTKGQLKIADAVHKVRRISNHFSHGIRKSDFMKIDRGLHHESINKSAETSRNESSVNQPEAA